MSIALQSLIERPLSTRPQRQRPEGVVSFLAIGGGAAVSFVFLSAVLVSQLPDVDAWVVSTLCYAGFILPVYLLHRRFAFRSDALHREALPRYLMVQAMAMLLATIFGYLFHGTLALPSLPAAMLVIGLTSGVNYAALKLWAFGRPKPAVVAVA